MAARWWEYYAVRYLVGTVVGSVAVAFLTTVKPFDGRLPPIGNSAADAVFGVSLFTALGFAFCYVASSPMLTLHAGRIHLRVATLKGQWFNPALLLGAPVCTAAAFWFFLPPSAALVAGSVIGIQVALVLIVIASRFADVEKFYRELAIARADGTGLNTDRPLATPAAEYIESYRHLREHGNAVSIVILEIALAFAIYKSPSIGAACSIVLLWTLPSTSAWLIGSVLERRFATRPLISEGNRRP